MVTLQAPQPLFLIGANAPQPLLPSNRKRNRSSVAFAAGCCASNRSTNSSSLITIKPTITRPQRAAHLRMFANAL
jgi:hypothetical protein